MFIDILLLLVANTDEGCRYHRGLSRLKTADPSVRKNKKKLEFLSNLGHF